MRSPVLVVLLVAPFFGETLSTSTPPLDLILPWNLALMAALYGSGALICREVARRCRLGLLGLCLLAAAYGVYEEALIDRYWFNPQFWADVGVGSYSVVWHTNLLLAAHLTAFHTAVSIAASVLVVERLFPDHRQRAWVGRRGLALTSITLGVIVPFVTAEFPRPPLQLLVAAGFLCLALVAGALLIPRARPARVPSARRPRHGLGLIAFTATASHFVLVYAVPSTPIPWPLGIAIALAPIAVGVVLVHRMGTGGTGGRDELRVVTGILAFFVLLDALVGLGGRYDLTAAALATALALGRLNSRSAALDVRPPTSADST